MGWNGSGVVTRDNGTNSGANTWENDRDASIKITAENHDTHDQDLADAIQNTIAKDGQNFPTADLPMNNQKHTGVGAATAATHYARADQVQNGAFIWGGTAAGTADAITFNLTPTLTAYTTGLTVRFLANGTTTVTNPTININAAGAKTVKDQDGNALSVGDIASGTVYEAVYDGTDFRIYVAASQDLSDYVTGPASTTENNVPQWDSATKQLKDGLAVGASANSLVQLDSGGALPAVSGQNLTDLKAAVTGSSSNLAGAYATAATATYTADEIILKNSSGSTYVAKSVSFTVDITASGVNGLDTGSEASNTWYYVHAVYNGTSTNGLISASATAPTLPSGYTYSALMGVIRNDGSGDFFPFLQKDRKISTQPNSVFASVAGVSSFTSVSVSSQVPPIAKSCDGWFGHASINITSGVRVASDANGLGAQALAAQSSGIVYDGYAIRMTFIDLKCPSQTIYWASVNVGTATHAMAIVGYQI